EVTPPTLLPELIWKSLKVWRGVRKDDKLKLVIGGPGLGKRKVEMNMCCTLPSESHAGEAGSWFSAPHARLVCLTIRALLNRDSPGQVAQFIPVRIGKINQSAK